MVELKKRERMTQFGMVELIKRERITHVGYNDKQYIYGESEYLVK
jgi:hypothetical protein